MIPASFDYVRPGSLDEAVAALAQAGEDAKLLAGGQSLLPLLRLRLAFPELVIDLGGIEALRGIHTDGDTLVIGATTRHHDVLHDPLVREHAGLLAEATGTVADPAVRHRGTLGGSLSHADPAGDLPAVIVALEAELVAHGPDGRRTIPAREFFVDYLQTAMDPDEILTEIRVPSHAGWGFHYEKFQRVAQAWAIVGVAAAVRRDDGQLSQARIGLTNMGPTPIRAAGVESALTGEAADADRIRQAAESAAEGTSPPSDLSGAADYRKHLVRVLTRRAVLAAAGVG